MIDSTFETLWRDAFSPFAVGFENSLNELNTIANSKSQNSNYPPYNIRRVSENEYTIELAVAGFAESDIDVELTGETLAIVGAKPENANDGLIHHGLACRQFTRKFVIAEDMVVKGAAMENGLLIVALQRIIPEHKQPRKINLTSVKKLLKTS